MQPTPVHPKHLDEAIKRLIPAIHADKDAATAMMRFSMVAHDSVLLACDMIADLCEVAQGAGLSPPKGMAARVLALQAVMSHPDARLTERMANAIHGAARAVADAEAS